MTDTSPTAEIKFEVIRARNRAARNIVAGFAAEMPTLDYFWRYITTALADTPALIAELTRTRLDRANLAAAAKASIAAYHDGERDPLTYLRDELSAPEHHINSSGQAQ